MINYYVRTHVTTLLDVSELIIQELRRNEIALTDREKTALSVIEYIRSELLGALATLRVEEGFKND